MTSIVNTIDVILLNSVTVAVQDYTTQTVSSSKPCSHNDNLYLQFMDVLIAFKQVTIDSVNSFCRNTPDECTITLHMYVSHDCMQLLT